MFFLSDPKLSAISFINFSSKVNWKEKKQNGFFVIGKNVVIIQLVRILFSSDCCSTFVEYLIQVFCNDLSFLCNFKFCHFAMFFSLLNCSSCKNARKPNLPTKSCFTLHSRLNANCSFLHLTSIH